MMNAPKKTLIRKTLLSVLLIWSVAGADTGEEHPKPMPRRAKAALALNLLYPGAGHHLLGNRGKAFPYILGETFLLYSGVWSLTKGLEPVLEYSKMHAWAHAGANPEVDDPHYWEAMSYYDNVESYNRDNSLNPSFAINSRHSA